MDRFDADELKSRLAAMFVLCRVAFAASCCERLLPNYVKFSETVNWGNPAILRSGLGEVWESLEGGTFDIERITGLIKECDEVLPDTEDFDSLYTSAALDAGTAVLDTLECCFDGDPKHAVDVATFSRDTVDMFIRNRYAIESDPQSELIVANHPLMIKELKRQSEDLQTLSETRIFDAQFVRLFRGIATTRGSSIMDN